jgi:hypothetical protein
MFTDMKEYITKCGVMQTLNLSMFPFLYVSSNTIIRATKYTTGNLNLLNMSHTLQNISKVETLQKATTD